jgi:hypothetical protein
MGRPPSRSAKQVKRFCGVPAQNCWKVLRIQRVSIEPLQLSGTHSNETLNVDGFSAQPDRKPGIHGRHRSGLLLA